LISAAYASHVYDLGAAVRYARKVVEEADPKDKSRDTAKAYEGASLIFIHAIDLEQGERLLRKAIEISEEMGYRDLLAWQYAILTWMYRYHKRFPGSRECLQSAWKKAFSHLPHVKPNLPDYALTCNELAIDAKDYDQKFYLLSEALDAGVKSGSVWPAVESGLQLGALYRGRGETRKAIETYEKAWQIGVRARHVLLGHLVSIIQGLMELCDSQNERQKLLQMMLQMVDSTLVLHSKPEVYPMAQRRWNDTVEEILKTLHNAVPEACGDLEHELRSRLVEADTDGKRFFYRGQLMLLATLDSRPEDAETIARELRKLRQSAGSFAQRISMRMEHIIEMMNARADQRPAVAAKLLKSYDQFEDLWRASDLIVRLVQKDESAQLLDWDHVNRLALQSLQAISGPLRLHNLCNALWRVETLYKMMERPDMFHQVCKQFTDEHPEIRQELGITQLHLEPHEPSASYSRLDSIDTFNGNALEQAWKGGDPDEVCVTELIPSSGLQITVPPGSLRTPSLRQSISGDFAVETRMSDGEAGKKSGGLRVWKDGDNSIHFDASQFGLEGTVQLGFARSGQRLIAGQGLLESAALTLRLERKGDRFTGYVSADDENWYRCGWADIPMEDPVEVGIHTLHPGASATSTRFEHFKIYRKIKEG
jgi:tetratricopeptide (TPR) repeat protein